MGSCGVSFYPFFFYVLWPPFHRTDQHYTFPEPYAPNTHISIYTHTRQPVPTGPGHGGNEVKPGLFLLPGQTHAHAEGEGEKEREEPPARKEKSFPIHFACFFNFFSFLLPISQPSEARRGGEEERMLGLGLHGYDDEPPSPNAHPVTNLAVCMSVHVA